MSEEHEKQFASWFAKFITQTQKLDYESICKKAFMAGVEAARQSVQPTCSTCGAKLRSGDIWWNECENCHSKIASG